jgi:hypothetical protein
MIDVGFNSTLKKVTVILKASITFVLFAEAFRYFVRKVKFNK